MFVIIQSNEESMIAAYTTIFVNINVNNAPTNDNTRRDAVTLHRAHKIDSSSVFTAFAIETLRMFYGNVCIAVMMKHCIHSKRLTKRYSCEHVFCSHNDGVPRQERLFGVCKIAHFAHHSLSRHLPAPFSLSSSFLAVDRLYNYFYELLRTQLQTETVHIS